jgi:hypothetical protein
MPRHSAEQHPPEQRLDNCSVMSFIVMLCVFQLNVDLMNVMAPSNRRPLFVEKELLLSSTKLLKSKNDQNLVGWKKVSRVTLPPQSPLPTAPTAPFYL